MSKKIAIVQSNYIPWKGYFDLINGVDEFILYDDAQYTRRDWRNRNMIKTPIGPMWLTIPVEVKGRYLQRICETRISDPDWMRRHWKSIAANYCRARYFQTYRDAFEDLYVRATDPLLSRINHHFLTAICSILNIGTRLSWSSDYLYADAGAECQVEGKTERLVFLCKQTDATEYVSGPSARDYIDPQLFEDAGITLTFMDYSGYPEHEQLFPPFSHHVSIIDLLFNEGPHAVKYMKRFWPCAEHECGSLTLAATRQNVVPR
jgi:WbqC-like protein